MSTTNTPQPSQPPTSPSTTPNTSAPHNLHLPRPSTDRLGLTLPQRLLLANSSALLFGFALGSSYAGHMASLRYRAENAHRLPHTQPGWYLYHKSKNYYKMKHGIISGLKKGIFLMAWANVFFLLEESFDIFRGTCRAERRWNGLKARTDMVFQDEDVWDLDIEKVEAEVRRSRDFWSSAAAGMVSGGLWSVWNRFPAQTAARTMRWGLVAGLGFGLFQDGLRWVRVNKVGERDLSWMVKGKEEERLEMKA